MSEAYAQPLPFKRYGMQFSKKMDDGLVGIHTLETKIHVFVFCREKNADVHLILPHHTYNICLIISGCAAGMVKAGDVGYATCTCCRLSAVPGKINAEIDIEKLFVFVRGYGANFSSITGDRSCFFSLPHLFSAVIITT